MNELDVLTVGYNFELLHLGIKAASAILVAIGAIVFGRKLFPILSRDHALEPEGKLLIGSFVFGTFTVTIFAIFALFCFVLAHIELSNLAQGLNSQERMRNVEVTMLSKYASAGLFFLAISVGALVIGGLMSIAVEMRSKMKSAIDI